MSARMRKAILFSSVLLGGAFLRGPVAQGQSKSASADVAITYVAERAKIASIDCGCFWLQGGSGDVAVTFFHGLGVAANLTGVHSGDIGTGVELDQVMFAMGPRYTFSAPWTRRMSSRHAVSMFGEGLFGGIHGFNTIFPTSQGAVGAASSFATQVGGGIDLQLKRHVGVRAIEAEYVRSTLPNGTGDVQHDLRLAAGVVFHFDSMH